MYLSNKSSSRERCGGGRTVPSAGRSPGPAARSVGLVTVLICIPCLKVGQAQPDTLFGSRTPGDPWFSGAARSTAAASGSSAPGSWSGTPRASIPTGRPPTSCCGLSEPAHAGRVPSGRGPAGHLTLPSALRRVRGRLAGCLCSARDLSAGRLLEWPSGVAQARLHRLRRRRAAQPRRSPPAHLKPALC